MQVTKVKGKMIITGWLESNEANIKTKKKL